MSFKYYKNYKENGMDRACSTDKKEVFSEFCYKNLKERQHREDLGIYGRHRWICLAQDMDQWQAAVKAVVNL
jgi:hypothetical protein